MSDRLTSINEEGVYEPFKISQVPWEEFTRGSRFGMRLQHLSSFGSATRTGVANLGNPQPHDVAALP